MPATHVYLDESSFTGQDLLNPYQPVFCLASTTLDDATAERYHQELLEHSGAREVKHSRLMRRPLGQTKIARFLQQIKSDGAFAVWTCHKRFALLTFFVDLWCEPAAYLKGFDLYKDGAGLVLANMTYFCLPVYTSDEFLEMMLRDFQVMMTSRSKKSYEQLLSKLLRKYDSSAQDVQELLRPFVASMHMLGYDILMSIPEGAIDPALPGLARLCHHWRSLTPGPFVVHHDQATQLARDRHVWEVLLSKHMSPAEFGFGDRHAIFPVNVERTVFVDSFSEVQVQLCDVVAGALATFARAQLRGETSPYIELLREVDMVPLVTATIWPELEADPDKLGTNGWSGAMIEYIAGELDRRAQNRVSP